MRPHEQAPIRQSSAHRIPRRPDRRRRQHFPNGRAARRLGRHGLCRPALQSDAEGRAASAEQLKGRCGRRRLGPDRRFSRLRRIQPRVAGGCAQSAEARRGHLGHRQLPQYLPCGRHAAGSRVLDPQRHRVAQDQPDAEFPRPAFHQRARNDDLGGTLGEVQIHIQLRSHEGAQRRAPDALGLAHSGLRRPRAHQGGRRQKGAPDAKARIARVSRRTVLHTRRRDCTRSVLWQWHHGCRRQASWPTLHRLRARRNLRGRGHIAHPRHKARRSRLPQSARQARGAAHSVRLARGTRPLAVGRGSKRC